MQYLFVAIVLGLTIGCVEDAGLGVLEDAVPKDAHGEVGEVVGAVELVFARQTDDENAPSQTDKAFLVVVPLGISRELAVIVLVDGQTCEGSLVSFTLSSEDLFALDATEALSDDEGVAMVNAQRVGCDGVSEVRACVPGQEPSVCLTFRLRAIDGCLPQT